MSPSPLASPDQALVQLADLASGLLFVSEADHALRVVRLGVITETELPSAICAQLSRVDAPVQCVELGAFFEPATRSQPYHTAPDRAVAERYRTLVRFLSHELANARAYRVGEIEVDAYALGQSLQGEWLGVATKLIET